MSDSAHPDTVILRYRSKKSFAAVIAAITQLTSSPHLPTVHVRRSKSDDAVWVFYAEDVISDDVASSLETIIVQLVYVLKDKPDPKELEVQFDVSGVITQTIQITDPSIDAGELLEMLQTSAAFTSVSVGSPVVKIGGSGGMQHIGVVTNVESNSEYDEFQEPGQDTEDIS